MNLIDQIINFHSAEDVQEILEHLSFVITSDPLVKRCAILNYQGGNSVIAVASDNEFFPEFNFETSENSGLFKSGDAGLQYASFHIGEIGEVSYGLVVEFAANANVSSESLATIEKYCFIVFECIEKQHLAERSRMLFTKLRSLRHDLNNEVSIASGVVSLMELTNYDQSKVHELAPKIKIAVKEMNRILTGTAEETQRLKKDPSLIEK